MQPFIRDFICGSVSGVGNCISGYIFDTLKVRMQMDPSLSMLSAIKHNLHKQGFINLFNGIYYPLVTIPLVNAVIFSSYQLYKKIREKEELSFVDGIQNGAFAGLVNTIIVSPVQLVKCIMQTDTQNKYKNSKQCMKEIIKSSGVKGLFKGAFATAFRQIFAYAAQFAAYEYLKNAIVCKEHPHLSFGEGMLVGMAAGLNCWIFSYPQDIVKTHLQLDQQSIYKKKHFDGGFFDCASKLYKSGGIKGFFVGIEPCLIRAAVANAFGIAIYQKCQYAWTHHDYVENY